MIDSLMLNCLQQIVSYICFLSDAANFLHLIFCNLQKNIMNSVLGIGIVVQHGAGNNKHLLSVGAVYFLK